MPSNMEAIQKIKEIKSRKIIIGENIDLFPYSTEFIDDIIRLRNQEEARYFLAQKFSLTREQQLSWMQNYELTDTEVGFVIKDKKGTCMGLMFLYDYKAESNTIELGRLVFDLQKTKGGPYFLEGMLVIMDLAFEVIEVDKIVAAIKKDNTQTIKFARKLGFMPVGECVIRNEEYVSLEVPPGNRDYKDHYRVVQAWKHKTIQ
jgi:RimJ/RimL family protein N-acetyltransferase